MKYGPGPDGTPPVVREVTRADGLWPFLLIRQHGRHGQAAAELGDDVRDQLWRARQPGHHVHARGVRDRPDRRRPRWLLRRSRTASSVPPRVRDRLRRLGARLEPGPDSRDGHPCTRLPRRSTPNVYLGGAFLDLGDRLSESAHLFVKAGTYTAGAAGEDSFSDDRRDRGVLDRRRHEPTISWPGPAHRPPSDPDPHPDLIVASAPGPAQTPVRIALATMMTDRQFRLQWTAIPR